MQVLEKMSTSKELTQTQLDAIKNRAIALWADRWLIELCYKYAEVLGLQKREKTSLVRGWFLQDVTPSLENFNNLLLAVGCRIRIECEIIQQIL